MNAKDYIKVVEWSEEDGCYVGSAPPLVGRCCHGDTEAEVFAQLAVIVDDLIETYNRRGLALPEADAGKEFSGKFVVRVRPEIHKATMIRAMQERRSLNAYVERVLEGAVKATA
jgi:predicted HicB family RNase H-like nuclease